MTYELTYDFEELDIGGGVLAYEGTAVIAFDAPDHNDSIQWELSGVYTTDRAGKRHHMDAKSPAFAAIAAALALHKSEAIEEDCRDSLSEDWSGTASRMAQMGADYRASVR